MQGKNFDIFISYRRSDGDEIAAKINETLKGNHYRCFFDFESLKNGRFDERIERAIEDAPVFIALLTPHYLERPKEDKETEVLEEDKENQEQDWVIREIECAIKNKRKIIPIDYNRKFTDYPKSISEEIKKGLGGHNFAVVSSGQQYPRDMKALMEEWISEVVPPPTQKTQGKANIEVLSDANCDILKAGEVIATISKGGYNILKLPAGRHRLICRSNEFSDIEQRTILEINKDLAEDFIDVKLADKVQERRNEIAEKEKAEEEAEKEIIAEAIAKQDRIKREKFQAEEKLQVEKPQPRLKPNLDYADFNAEYNRCITTEQYPEAFALCLNEAVVRQNVSSIKSKADIAIENLKDSVLIPDCVAHVSYNWLIDRLSAKGYSPIKMHKNSISYKGVIRFRISNESSNMTQVYIGFCVNMFWIFLISISYFVALVFAIRLFTENLDGSSITAFNRRSWFWMILICSSSVLPIVLALLVYVIDFFKRKKKVIWDLAKICLEECER